MMLFCSSDENPAMRTSLESSESALSTWSSEPFSFSESKTMVSSFCFSGRWKIYEVIARMGCCTYTQKYYSCKYIAGESRPRLAFTWKMVPSWRCSSWGSIVDSVWIWMGVAGLGGCDSPALIWSLETGKLLKRLAQLPQNVWKPGGNQ